MNKFLIACLLAVVFCSSVLAENYNMTFPVQMKDSDGQLFDGIDTFTFRLKYSDGSSFFNQTESKTVSDGILNVILADVRANYSRSAYFSIQANGESETSSMMLTNSWDSMNNPWNWDGSNNVWLKNSSMNVGIGTNNPTAKLHVNGSINVTVGNDFCIDGGVCLNNVDTDTRWSLGDNILYNCSGNICVNQSNISITESQITDLQSYQIGSEIGNCSADQSCPGILYDSNASDFYPMNNPLNFVNSSGGDGTGGWTNTSTTTSTGLNVNVSGNITSNGAQVTTGSGTANYISMWNGTNSQKNSIIAQNGLLAGINTNNPQGVLDVHKTASSSTRFFVLSNDAITNPISSYGWEHFLGFISQGTTLGGGLDMVGIGTSATATGFYFDGIVGSTAPTAPAIVLTAWKATAGGAITQMTGTEKVFQANPSNFNLLANGNTGIGTSTPSQRLDVNGSVNITGNLYVGGCIMYNTSGTPVTLGTCT
jgi:hypothetical protein